MSIKNERQREKIDVRVTLKKKWQEFRREKMSGAIQSGTLGIELISTVYFG